MNALDNARAHLARITLGPAWPFKPIEMIAQAYSGEISLIEVLIRYTVPDRLTGEPTSIMLRRVLPPEYLETFEMVKELVVSMLKEILYHEVLESVFIDGKHDDPHANDPIIPPVLKFT